MATSDGVPRTPYGQGSVLDNRHILQHGFPPAQRQSSSSSTASSSAMRGKKTESLPLNHPKTYSTSSSHNTQLSSSTRADNRIAQRDVRTLPPWIDSFEEGEDAPLNVKPSTRLLSSLTRAHSAQHHHTPSQPERRVSQDGFVDTYEDGSHIEKKPETGFFGGHREPVKGRKWDHAREGVPVIMQSGVLPTSSLWRTYIKSSMYGPAISEDAKRVDEEFLQQQTPGYQKPWRGDLEGNEDSEKLTGLLHLRKRRRSLIQRFQHTLLMHPSVPLIFRMIVLTTSTIALGLAASVHHLSDKYKYPQNPSTTMAVVVDVVAMPYILYITWDEYTGKPLGLRSPKAKIRLVLLDVFFIIFESANLSLAFAALTDSNGSCQSSGNGLNSGICGRVKALCGILMMALIAWSMTFAVSIFRLVERVGGREESD